MSLYYDIFMQKKITQIERRIETVKAELVELGDMRPGSLSTQSEALGVAGHRTGSRIRIYLYSPSSWHQTETT